MEHIDGTVDRGDVKLYALSTCVWCKKTRQLLEELGMTYDYEYVDLAAPDRRDEIEAEIVGRVGRAAYPTICTPDECVTGYRPDEIRRLLDL
jgi:glutaredoxin